MQIIIVQTEIEEAIRNHVLNQVSVREGMQINIDLSATRGPEGFKATIDIVPADGPVTGSQEAPLDVSKATRGSADTSETQETQAQEGAQETKADNSADASTAVTGKKTSIFGGLNKPDNSKAAETKPEEQTAEQTEQVSAGTVS